MVGMGAGLGSRSVAGRRRRRGIGGQPTVAAAVAILRAPGGGERETAGATAAFTVRSKNHCPGV